MSDAFRFDFALPARQRVGRACLHAVLWMLACAGSLALAPTAHADVWGYVDDKGTAHFAAERVDERYALFYRGDDFDSTRDMPAAATPRPVAVPVGSKLLAFFDVSPAYKRIKHVLRDAAARHELDYELLQAVVATESGFDSDAVSPRGAIGLMQVMPTTAQRWGVAGDARTPLEKKLADPATNVGAGARYLRHLIDLFPGQIELALAAYNAGEGAVQRAGNQIPNYRETQNYVKTVMQLYAQLKPPPPAALARSRMPATRVRVELDGGTPVH